MKVTGINIVAAAIISKSIIVVHFTEFVQQKLIVVHSQIMPKYGTIWRVLSLIFDPKPLGYDSSKYGTYCKQCTFSQIKSNKFYGATYVASYLH